jgi:hypothetical protein
MKAYRAAAGRADEEKDAHSLHVDCCCDDLSRAACELWERVAHGNFYATDRGTAVPHGN